MFMFKKILLPLAVFILLPFMAVASTTPPSDLGVPVSFIKADCPTNLVTQPDVNGEKTTKVNVVYYNAGVLSCDPNDGVTLIVTLPNGTPAPSLSFVCKDTVHEFTISNLENGKYGVEASLSGSPQLPSSKCSFTASFQKETPVPELSEWSLLAVLLSVFGLLGVRRKK